VRQGSLLMVVGTGVDGVTVTTDALRLRHALDELLHNATRFTVGGIVRLAVETAADTVAVTVTDEGPGLPAALAHRLFEPFAGEQGQTGAGLGLGLAAAARIAASLGGELTRADQPVGESFTLSFAR
jgi:signal transduction histidine kinase